MKTLVVFYSRTGSTKKLSQYLIDKLGCDSEEIIDFKDRQGVWGYVQAGKEATKGETTRIQDCQKNPTDYDLVIIGTPVWVGTMSSAIRTYVEKYKSSFKEVAFFTTQGGAKEQRVFKNLEEMTGKAPKAKLFIRTGEVARDQFQEKADAFINELKSQGYGG